MLTKKKSADSAFFTTTRKGAIVSEDLPSKIKVYFCCPRITTTVYIKSWWTYTLKEEIFAGRNFADFAVFAKIREIKFPRKFLKSGVREIFQNWAFAKLKVINVYIEIP